MPDVDENDSVMVPVKEDERLLTDENEESVSQLEDLEKDLIVHLQSVIYQS